MLFHPTSSASAYGEKLTLLLKGNGVKHDNSFNNNYNKITFLKSAPQISFWGIFLVFKQFNLGNFYNLLLNYKLYKIIHTLKMRKQC